MTLIPGKLYKLKEPKSSEVCDFIFIFIKYEDSPHSISAKRSCVWFLMFDNFSWRETFWFRELMENQFDELEH